MNNYYPKKHNNQITHKCILTLPSLPNPSMNNRKYLSISMRLIDQKFLIEVQTRNQNIKVNQKVDCPANSNKYSRC